MGLALLSCNPNITWDIKTSIQINHVKDWQYICGNPSITPDIIEAHIIKPWHWLTLSINVQI